MVICCKKTEKKNGKPAHIQAHLAALSHEQLLRSQKSLHFAYAPKPTATLENSLARIMGNRKINNLKNVFLILKI